MPLEYEPVRAGTSETNADTGEELARKINGNFQKAAQAISRAARIDGNGKVPSALQADKLSSPAAIKLDGDVTSGPIPFDGSESVTLSTAISEIPLHKITGLTDNAGKIDASLLPGSQDTIDPLTKVDKVPEAAENNAAVFAADGNIKDSGISLISGWNEKAQRNELQRPNLLANGDFRLWQHGGLFGSASGFTADKWWLQFGGVVTQTKPLPGGGVRCVYSSGSGWGCNLMQAIDLQNAPTLRGKAVTASVACDAVGDWFLRITQGDSYSGGFVQDVRSRVVDGKAARTITVQKTGRYLFTMLSNDRSSMQAGHYINARYVKLEEGGFATPFIPRPIEQESILCMQPVELKLLNGWIPHWGGHAAAYRVGGMILFNIGPIGSGAIANGGIICHLVAPFGVTIAHGGSFCIANDLTGKRPASVYIGSTGELSQDFAAGALPWEAGHVYTIVGMVPIKTTSPF